MQTVAPELLTIPLNHKCPDTSPETIDLLCRGYKPVYITHGGLGDERTQQVYDLICRGRIPGIILIYELFLGPNGAVCRGDIYRYIQVGLEPERILNTAYIAAPRTSDASLLFSLDDLANYSLDLLRCGRALSRAGAVGMAIRSAAKAGFIDWAKLVEEMCSSLVTDPRLHTQAFRTAIKDLPRHAEVAIDTATGMPSTNVAVKATLNSVVLTFVESHR